MEHKGAIFAVQDIKKCFRVSFTGLFAGISAWIWWFLLYPELCFPQDTYEIVYEADAGEAGLEKELEEQLNGLLLQADKEQVIVKSRLLEWIKQYRNQ